MVKLEGESLTYIILINFNGYQDTVECLSSLQKSKVTNFRIIVVDNGSIDGSIPKILSWFENKLHLPPVHTGIEEIEVIQQKNELSYSYVHENEIKSGFYFNSKILLIEAAQNHGFAGGNNLATKVALQDPKCKYLWYLNNDTVVKNSTLNELVKFSNASSSNSKIGCVQSKVMFYNNPTVIQAFGGVFKPKAGKIFHLGYGETDNGQYDRFELNLSYVYGASLFVTEKFIHDSIYI